MAMLHPKSYQNMDIVYITVVAVLAKVMEGIQMLFFSASVNVFSWVSGRRLWSWNLILCNEIKQGKKSCTPSDVGLSTQVRCSAEFQKSRPPNRWMPISELKSRVTLPKQWPLTNLADCENSFYVNIDKDLHKASHLQGWWWFVL